MKPTDSQRRAIEAFTHGDVCVVAGPGSGKTTVLVERFRWLVSEKGIRPDEIAAITFTEKAAANMLERLVARAEPEHRRAYQLAQISTIHAFCARLLREHALEAGLDPAFEVMDAWEAEIQLRRSVAAVLDRGYLAEPQRVLEFLRDFYGSGAYAEGMELSSVHKEIADLYNAMREWGRRPGDLTDDEGFSPLQRRGRAWLIETLVQVEQNYREEKRAYGWLDFSDLQQETIDLIEASPAVRFPFQAILVDEYQDTNHLQKRLIELIQERAGEGSCRVFAVGDINQAIYGFRHADPEIFRDLRSKIERDKGMVIELGDNFRSRPEILKAVDVMFNRSDSGVERRQLKAAIEFPTKQAPCVDVIVARSERDGNAKDLEALLIAGRILELRRTLSIGKHKRAPRWKDFAILARSRSVIADIIPALRLAGIPYQLAAGSGFFDSPEVRDVLNFLRAARNPRNEVALAAYLRSAFAGVSADALFELKRRSGYRNLAATLTAIDPSRLPDSETVLCAREQLEAFRNQRDSVPAHVLLARFMSETGFEAYLAESEGGDLKVANIRKLLSVMRRLSEHRGLRFDEIVSRLDELQQSALDEPEADLAQEDLDAVSIMTMHAAKGLEFPVVILPSLQRPPPRGRKNTLYHPEWGVGARWAPPGSDDAEEDPAYAAIKRKYDQREKDETDRLLYVAMTRAEEHLVMSVSFPGNVRAAGWSKHVRAQFGVDFKNVTNSPEIHDRKGLKIRSLVTSEAPSFAPPSASEPPPASVSQVILIDPARPAEQSDSAAAATSIAMFAECPRRYYLSRYLGFTSARGSEGLYFITDDDPDPATEREAPPLEATELGQRVHDILAGNPANADEDKDVLELVRRFQESDLGRRARQAPKVTREEGLLFGIDGRLIRGQIDLWFDDGTEQVLIDYKTNSLKPAEVASAARAYELQLQLYAIGVEQWKGRIPSRAVLHFLRPDVVVDVDLSEAALRRARQMTEQFFVAQSNIGFPLRVEQHCYRCPYYRGLCPAEVKTPAGPWAAEMKQASLW